MRMGSAAVVPGPLRESTTACGRKNYARFRQFFSVLVERSYGLVSDIGAPRTMTALHARALVRVGNVKQRISRRPCERMSP